MAGINLGYSCQGNKVLKQFYSLTVTLLSFCQYVKTHTPPYSQSHWTHLHYYCVHQRGRGRQGREREKQEQKEYTGRYSKLLAFVLISKEHQLELAYFLLFSTPKFHATIPTP